MKPDKKRISFKVIFLVLVMAIIGLIVLASLVDFYGFSVSPDGKYAVISSWTGVSVYDLSNGALVCWQAGRAHGYQPYAQGEYANITWSPDGSLLAVGKFGNGVWIWDTQTWSLLAEQDGSRENEENESGFAWSPDSRHLALGEGDGAIRIWDRDSNTWMLSNSAGSSLKSLYWGADGLIALVGYQLMNV